MRTSVVAPYAAYLRVYEPLAVFPERQRVGWTTGGRTVGVVDEQRAALANTIPTPPLVALERESEDAFVLVVDGAAYACPWQTRLRSWEALESFPGQQLPAAVREAFLPRVVLEQARADHRRWRHAHPDERPHILTSTWHVPLAWFALVEDGERVLELHDGRALRYRTPMAQARRRAARALRTLRRTVRDVEVVEAEEDVARWLEEFHPRSLVELDYGGLVHLLDDRALEEDHSAAEAAAALGALSRGEDSEAATVYAGLLRRWNAVRALEHAN